MSSICCNIRFLTSPIWRRALPLLNIVEVVFSENFVDDRECRSREPREMNFKDVDDVREGGGCECEEMVSDEY